MIYELNSSGKYFAFKEQLKHAVVKIVREKYLRTSTFEDRQELQVNTFVLLFSLLGFLYHLAVWYFSHHDLFLQYWSIKKNYRDVPAENDNQICTNEVDVQYE